MLSNLLIIDGGKLRENATINIRMSFVMPSILPRCHLLSSSSLLIQVSSPLRGLTATAAHVSDVTTPVKYYHRHMAEIHALITVQLDTAISEEHSTPREDTRGAEPSETIKLDEVVTQEDFPKNIVMIWHQTDMMLTCWSPDGATIFMVTMRLFHQWMPNWTIRIIIRRQRSPTAP